MKKLLMIFMSLAFFTACSSDDDSNTNNDDPILGVWFLADVENGESIGFTENECNTQSSLDFEENGTAAAEFFSLTEGNCNSDSDSVSWTNIGDSRYRIQLPFEGLGPQPGRVEFNGTTSFTFYPDILSDAQTNITFEKR